VITTNWQQLLVTVARDSNQTGNSDSDLIDSDICIMHYGSLCLYGCSSHLVIQKEDINASSINTFKNRLDNYQRFILDDSWVFALSPSSGEEEIYLYYFLHQFGTFGISMISTHFIATFVFNEFRSLWISIKLKFNSLFQLLNLNKFSASTLVCCLLTTVSV